MQTPAIASHLFLQYEPFDGNEERSHIRDAGERDFRDFFRLPPAQENRNQPADPVPTN
jgi:hypothetical protein